MTGEIWWYLTRAGGMLGWALVAMSMVWGLLQTSKVSARWRGRSVIDVHQWLAGVGVIFTLIHVGVLIPESFINLSIAGLLVPGMSSWNPLGVALGVVALYLLVAVEVTSLLRRRLPQKWWRRMHFASFGLFWLGTVHAVMAGTDAGNPVFAWTVIGTVGAVLFLTLLRIITPRGRRVPRPTAIPAEAA